MNRGSLRIETPLSFQTGWVSQTRILSPSHPTRGQLGDGPTHGRTRWSIVVHSGVAGGWGS